MRTLVDPPPLRQPSRLRRRLEGLLLRDNVDGALQWLHEAGVLALLLPELAATIGFSEEIDTHHKDLWAHTKQVVSQTPARLDLRWAALLHDIGKVPTRRVEGNKVTFIGHERASAKMFDRIASRLAFPEALHRRVRFLIRHHGRPSQYDSGWTDAAVRRFDRETGEYTEALLALARADVTSAFAERRAAIAQRNDELAQRISDLRTEDARLPNLPSGIGREIMAAFELQPGRVVGQLKRELEILVDCGELEPHREAGYYIAWLRQHSSTLRQMRRNALQTTADRSEV